MTPAAFRAARLALGMYQTDLALAFDVTSTTISNIERGEAVPRIYWLAMIGLAYERGALPLRP